MLLVFVHRGLLSLVQHCLAIPFGLYSSFVVEERHGFNKSTLGLFFADKVSLLRACHAIDGHDSLSWSLATPTVPCSSHTFLCALAGEKLTADDGHQCPRSGWNTEDHGAGGTVLLRVCVVLHVFLLSDHDHHRSGSHHAPLQRIHPTRGEMR